MTDVDDLRAGLDAARGELLAALEGMTQEQLMRRPPGEVTVDEQRWPIRDMLWHGGTVEDWIHRMASQALGGGPVDGYVAPRRPSITNTLGLLLDGLEQRRDATLALICALDDRDLAIEFTTPANEHRTIGRVLAHLGVHDRQHREQALALRDLPEVER